MAILVVMGGGVYGKFGLKNNSQSSLIIVHFNSTFAYYNPVNMLT